MPWFVSVLLSGLLQIAASLAGRLMLALGFGFVEFAGISALISSARDYANSAFDALAGSMLFEWAGFFKLDVHLSIILSAIGVKVALNALGGDRVRKIVSKG